MLCSDSVSERIIWVAVIEMRVERFGGLLSETIGVTMRQVFGQSASELIYSLMERQVSLKREEVGERIEVFHAYVEKLVGSEVAQIILAIGLKRLCTEIRREYEEVERYFSVLDELYEVKFRLFASLLKEEGSTCN